MAGIEHTTITLPHEMAAIVRGAVEEGEYASSSEVVREALRDWKTKRALQLRELSALKADIDTGLTDLAEGRVKDFDDDRIVERGRQLLAGRSPLRLTEAAEAIAARFIAPVEKAFEPVRLLPVGGAPRGHLAPGPRVMFHGAMRFTINRRQTRWR